MERVVRKRFSDNGEQPTNQSAAYQAGYAWLQALVPVHVEPSHALWVWLTSDSGWKPFWTELTEASTACYARAHCGCKKGCRRPGKCRASNLQCTDLCKCSGACGGNVQLLFSCPSLIAFRFIVSITNLIVHGAHYDYVLM